MFERTALRISNKIRTSALVKLAPRKLSVLTEEVKTLRNCSQIKSRNILNAKVEKEEI